MSKSLRQDPILSGVLTGATEVIAIAYGLVLPMSVTFKSADGSRQIELSTDSGVEYFVPIYDKSTTTMLVVTIDAPISHIRLTGTVGDVWNVR